MTRRRLDRADGRAYGGRTAVVHVGTIVVIDPDFDARMRLADEMRLRRWAAFTAPDAVAGLELATREQPTCIVTDVILPEVDTSVLVKSLRSCVKHRLAIVGLAQAYEAAVEASREVGFDEVLPKPVNIVQLHDYLRRSRR